MSLRYVSWTLFIGFLCLMAGTANAAPEQIRPDELVDDVLRSITSYSVNDSVFVGAKTLFWSLAVISLVWTMGTLVVRQDMGEMMMEFLRFIIVTGIFYWLLINASDHAGGDGFIVDIVQSFLQMANGDPSDTLIRSKATGILARGLSVFYHVIDETGDGNMADQILSGLIAILILMVCALMAAQYVLVLVMAWVLGYAGIFLLGFGGSRWTSQIAINYYKHVVAVGAALLVIAIVGVVAADLLENLKYELNHRAYSAYPYLGLMLAACTLMMVLSIRVPQMIYTLVTGSTLGMVAGSATAAGTAIASAGSAAYWSAAGRPGPGHGGSPHGGGSTFRSDSVMDAVQRSAVMSGGMTDPFHVQSGSDPFGVPRRADPHRSGGESVFGDTPRGTSTGADSIMRASSGHGRKDVAWATPDVGDIAQHDVRAGSETSTQAARGATRGTATSTARSADAAVEASRDDTIVDATSFGHASRESSVLPHDESGRPGVDARVRVASQDAASALDATRDVAAPNASLHDDATDQASSREVRHEGVRPERHAHVDHHRFEPEPGSQDRVGTDAAARTLVDEARVSPLDVERAGVSRGDVEHRAPAAGRIDTDVTSSDDAHSQSGNTIASPAASRHGAPDRHHVDTSAVAGSADVELPPPELVMRDERAAADRVGTSDTVTATAASTIASTTANSTVLRESDGVPRPDLSPAGVTESMEATRPVGGDAEHRTGVAANGSPTIAKNTDVRMAAIPAASITNPIDRADPNAIESNESARHALPDGDHVDRVVHERKSDVRAGDATSSVSATTESTAVAMEEHAPVSISRTVTPSAAEGTLFAQTGASDHTGNIPTTDKHVAEKRMSPLDPTEEGSHRSVHRDGGMEAAATTSGESASRVTSDATDRGAVSATSVAATRTADDAARGEAAASSRTDALVEARIAAQGNAAGPAATPEGGEQTHLQGDMHSAKPIGDATVTVDESATTAPQPTRATDDDGETETRDGRPRKVRTAKSSYPEGRPSPDETTTNLQPNDDEPTEDPS
ncbi:P-type conjugative transfer protein TrbL [Luteibacter sp. 329MFSha]|uniref:P-type conjugative transfer protein TrbL n=1 Tax=Luteibacter sp. 329MFSha TaxID=1798239 RepID=UPI0008D2D139|nr:P-type conjugative transfer protein TrbL [Luteibacter sp. 329MFSha]SEW28444.1 P-type conjugative transfer protein TrbL [Luteibacter sp. 329MFSha]